jgi:catechol 2,3-dioxygenase-like lactoylglutathione lyase family enzyme
MQPLGLHHVAINVSDVDEAVRFYTGVLGLHARDDRPDFGFGGAWLDAGGQQVHLLEAPSPGERGQHFALWVADLDGVVGELRGKGVKVSDPVSTGADRQAFTNDPSGNAIELHEVGGAGAPPPGTP